MINPLLAERLYPLPQQHDSLGQPTRDLKYDDCRTTQHSLLAQLVDLRCRGGSSFMELPSADSQAAQSKTVVTQNTS